MEEERWKGRRELILTLTIGLPVQTFRGVGKREEKGVTDRSWKEKSTKGKRGRKEDTDSIASAKPDWTALSSSPS